MANEVMGKKLRYMSQDKYETITETDDELYAVSGSGIGFPSSKFDELTLGASGTEYTAPANGYFRANVAKGGSVMMYSNVLNGFNASLMEGGCSINLLKGAKMTLYYTGTITSFKFVYAEGE